MTQIAYNINIKRLREMLIMTNKELFIKAHKMTREIKAQHPDVDYRAQFGLCLSYVIKESKDVWNTLESKLNELVNSGKYDNWTCKDWVKGDFNRTYIKLVTYRNNGKMVEKDCGYYDNKTKEYVAFNKYTKVLNLLTGEVA